MKRYRLGRHEYWFDPDKAPEGAVEVKASKPANKAAKPANKSRKAKAVKDAD